MNSIYQRPSFQTPQEKINDKMQSRKRGENLSQKQSDIIFEEVLKESLAPKDDISIVISHCIYNEEQFFENVLYDDLNINDLDAIYILDGAWNHFKGGHQSNDKTLEIINNFKDKAANYNLKVIYEKNPDNQIWESEPVKRNYIFDRIAELFSTKPYYHIIKDGDEIFRSTTGCESVWLKKEMVKWIKTENNIGLLKGYAFNSHIMGSFLPRFFPSTRKIHYYTEKSMILHDENHTIISDYNSNVKYAGPVSLCFNYENYKLINYYPQRNRERRRLKEPFVEFIESQGYDDPCMYNSI